MVLVAYCKICRRSVYWDDQEDGACPVCATPLTPQETQSPSAPRSGPSG